VEPPGGPDPGTDESAHPDTAVAAAASAAIRVRRGSIGSSLLVPGRFSAFLAAPLSNRTGSSDSSPEAPAEQRGTMRVRRGAIRAGPTAERAGSWAGTSARQSADRNGPKQFRGASTRGMIRWGRSSVVRAGDS
jgi:hypothetical protein